MRFTPEEFVGLLSKLQPRLYSVASSLKAFPDQVHLIVDVVRYESHGRVRKGVASSFLAERADDVPVPVFPSNAKHFHLPENPDTPIIMVGPGTGVAPFRAYLQERQVTGAKGKNWLFFGAQHVKCDFAYEEDFDAFMKKGILTRLDCAWSRDQAHKIYVQHKMAENAAEIWKWIDAEGAQFFVCGDARRMAKDVDANPAQDCPGAGRQERRSSERIRRETEKREALQAGCVLENDEARMTNDEGIRLLPSSERSRDEALELFCGILRLRCAPAQDDVLPSFVLRQFVIRTSSFTSFVAY